MPNRRAFSYRFVAAGRKKFNLNFRAQGQIGDGEKAHADVAEIDAKSTYMGRLGEYLHGGIQQLALPATPVFEVGLKHDAGHL
jgi:hypothetical protein